ncbi:unnamed protein product, partial [Discosporangium mesarthrocarpum]
MTWFFHRGMRDLTPCIASQWARIGPIEQLGSGVGKRGGGAVAAVGARRSYVKVTRTEDIGLREALSTVERHKYRANLER